MSFAFALTCIARLRGLHRYKDFDGILVLAPCHDIHTWGMKRPLDVAFVSQDGRVLRSIRDLKPFKRVRCAQSALVLERYTCEQDWPQEGDRIRIGWASSASLDARF